jgi:ornithine decarboxylase
MTPRISRFLSERQPTTPCLVVDTAIVARSFNRLRTAMPDADIFYAIKANPAPDILEMLVELGSSFDAASLAEVRMVLAAGATADRISFGNTIKKEVDIAAAAALGVDLYAIDSDAELRKIARAAPGSRVFCRIFTTGGGADWPLSRKFGCEPALAADLLRLARDLGLVPYGVSFHVGSQQRNPRQWEDAIRQASELFRGLEDDGIELAMLNLGGGFPARYRRRTPPIIAYGRAIRAALLTFFGNRLPRLIVEPGRQLVGDAGVIHTEVVLISRRSTEDPRRWVYLDIGRFGGLAETEDEAIQYPIVSHRQGPGEAVVLAGPTCDSADILYERADYQLPLDLCIGDKLEIRAAGAYTSTYASVAFNGFEPLRCYCV